MAECSERSLLGLEEELTCSICLGTFVQPVTTPCGHNFCGDCLEQTWKDSYCCPQCRRVFATKPELTKNTVLCTVVDTFNQRATRKEEMDKEEEEHAIQCDTCMKAKAVNTCLTCMASFCEEHLRPHRENPIFRVHQLNEPIADLMERICSAHHKLMELFCTQHQQVICSQCLQAQHRECSFNALEEQKSLKEAELRGNLNVMDKKISKNEAVLIEMRDKENRLKESATNRKKMISVEYQQIRDMLSKEEHSALRAVDQEVESGQAKFKSLAKKFNENIDNMSKAKEDIHALLSTANTMAFLQVQSALPQAASYDPFAPRINLDSKKVIVSTTFASALKEHLAEILKQPLEFRLPIIKPDEARGSDSKPPSPVYQPKMSTMSMPFSPQFKSGAKKKPAGKDQPQRQGQAPYKGMGDRTKSMETFVEFKDMAGGQAADAKLQETQAELSELSLNPPVKRNDLLKFGTVLTLDPKTAHKRIVLSEGFKKAMVSDEYMNYSDVPERFTVCSQVMASKGFTRGRHYWEVRISNNNFIGIGVAYGSIDRKLPTSRLGRNNQSWCVEWFNVKLSAWHNNTQKELPNPCPKRVGVLLDCENGMVTFYSIVERAYPFHTFVFPFTEAVYPAFWIFSSGSFISLCQLQP